MVGYWVNRKNRILSLSDMKVDLSQYEDRLTLSNKLLRVLWNIVYRIAFRPFPTSILMPWRKMILRVFGAKMGKGSQVYCTARIWAPWNLEMGDYSCIASNVDCYNVDKITIGANSTISQKTYLCTASHDISNPKHPLITAPIFIADQAWVAADAFVGMGVTIGQGAVVGARAAVFKDVAPWTVVGGNPAKFIKERKIHE